MLASRPPARAAEAMVASSHPAATEAGLAVLRAGGNAVDAALASAAVLCVVEPMMTGLGGDLFALVAPPGEQPVGLDAAGPAPASIGAEVEIEESGPRSVTVPGAVAGWAELAGRFGSRGLDTLLSAAIELARDGFEVTPVVADWWQEFNPPGFPPAPAAGERRSAVRLARTLELIAAEGPAALYQGPVAAAIADASWLAPADLAGYRPRWVEPLRGSYRGHVVYEMPPPSQGVAVLEALALLERSGAGIADQVRCVALALEDAAVAVRDGAEVAHLLEPERVEATARRLPRLLAEPPGSTVYVAAVDGDGLCVSLIQSIFHAFGSGVLAGETGIVLQNRAAGFLVDGAITPGRRPYHTIIPALLAEPSGVRGPFGVVGGAIQAQAQVQLLCAVLDDGADPQAALERPRFRIEAGRLLLERGLWPRAAELAAAGAAVVEEPDYKVFGGGQMILRADGAGWIGGSDPRKDGRAAGF